MKPVIRTPYFEVGTKNYVYGDKLLEYARAADAAAEKYDIDVLFICPALEVRRVAENTKHLFVLATYMDTLRPGRGCADILPEGLKAAGAVGVMINHCEKPMSLPQMKKTIDRARELDFLVFACADTHKHLPHALHVCGFVVRASNQRGTGRRASLQTADQYAGRRIASGETLPGKHRPARRCTRD